MRKLTSFFLLVVLCTSGCALRAPMKRFPTKEQVGSVHVAVQSIAKFDDAYTDQLQPHFELSTAEALNAIAQTQVSEMERFRALLAEVKASGPKVTTTRELVTEEGDVTTDKTTEKSETVDPPSNAAPQPKGLTNNAPGVTPNATVQLDSSLRYRAAAALLQEIALFNRYVRDAAVSRGSVPYVVRLLVTVNPTAHREPYDVYTTISFFAHGESDAREEDVAVRTLGRQVQEEIYASGLEALKASKAQDVTCNRAVEIIPLFVTDNLESSLNSVANERVVDASGGFATWLSHLAAVFGFRGQAIDRDRSLARSVNGLTTISRVGANTILARLGAASANNQYEMVARTYNVTLLALIPSNAKLRGYEEEEDPDPFVDLVRSSSTPCKEFSFAAYSSFRDAVRGTEVPTAYKARRDRLVKAIAQAWDFNDVDAAAKALKGLLPLTQFGQYDKFRTAVTGNAALAGPVPLGELAFQNTLWHDLVTLNDRSGRSYGTFELPESTFGFFDNNQGVTLYDDGKVTTAVLNGGRNVDTDGLHARITVTTDKEDFFVDETAVKISEDRRRATFTFPSLHARLREGEQFKQFEFVAQKIESGARGTDTAPTTFSDPSATYRLIKATPREVATKMTVSSGNVRMKDGVGEIAVGFTAEDAAAAPVVLVEVEGGTISAVAPTVPFAGSALQMSGHGNYMLTLKNLFVDSPVKIKATLANGKAVGEKTLTVKQ